MIIKHKRGDSFLHYGPMPSSIPFGFFNGWSTIADLRLMGAGRLVTTLNSEWLDETTQTIKLSCVDTSKWPIGPLEFDIKFIREGDLFVRSSKKTLVIVGFDHE